MSNIEMKTRNEEKKKGEMQRMDRKDGKDKDSIARLGTIMK